jgi:Tfp pilus assembly protein PilZ
MMRKPSHMNATFQFKPNLGPRLRVFPRVRITGQVIIHDENNLYIAQLGNISAGGIFVDQLTSIPAGREVRIIIRSPRFGAPLQAKGTVVRVEGNRRKGVAIEFTGLTPEAKDAIQNCVFETRMEGVLKAA